MPHQLVYRHRHHHHRLARVRDVVLCSVALAAFCPIILLAMLAILIEDGRPFFFFQQRVGRFERLFVIYKLRTMKKAECGDRLSPTTGKDSRITNVGRFLRKTSIDELPQLINVIRGEMALVGPRPEMPFIVNRYERWQHLRHLATPGLTGVWQISERSEIPLHDERATALDLDYIRSASPVFDLSLICRTITAVFSTKGAY